MPADTAEAVRRLEAAGTRVGKANLHEFAWGITSENTTTGRVPNPLAAGRDRRRVERRLRARRWPPGSSTRALGTDSGGSIRIPAACCGIVGFKPT